MFINHCLIVLSCLVSILYFLLELTQSEWSEWVINSTFGYMYIIKGEDTNEIQRRLAHIPPEIVFALATKCQGTGNKTT